MKKVLIIVPILFIISACSSTLSDSNFDKGTFPSNSPSPAGIDPKTYTPTQKIQSISSSPTTEQPSITPIPPSATATPSISTKLVLLSQGRGAGDGGNYFYDYIMYGAGLPNIILYEDGQLLIRSENWYMESTLSNFESCLFVRSINDAITYAEGSNRYKGTPPPEDEFFNGEPVVYIDSVSDNPTGLQYSIHEEELLSDAFLWPFSLIELDLANYSFKPYEGEYMVLWTQTFDVNYPRGTRNIEQIAFWPDRHPNLDNLLIEISNPVMIVSGEEAADLMDELGHEPSLLVQTRLVDNEPGCFVLKDRFDVMNGASAIMPDIKFFQPHLDLLALGGKHAQPPSDSEPIFDQGTGPNWATICAQRDAVLENIKDDLTLAWPGQTAEAKKAKIKALRDHFNTSSWTELKEDTKKYPLDVLEDGRHALRGEIKKLKKEGK